jgi:elongation factor G
MPWSKKRLNPALPAIAVGIACDDATLAQVLKTYYTPQGGKLSLVRVWCGELKDGDSLNGERMGGLYNLMGTQQISLSRAEAGRIVAVARLEGAQTGDTLTLSGNADTLLPKAPVIEPVYALAITPAKRSDEVKLSAALTKLLEEDPSLFGSSTATPTR